MLSYGAVAVIKTSRDITKTFKKIRNKTIFFFLILWMCVLKLLLFGLTKLLRKQKEGFLPNQELPLLPGLLQ